MKLWLSSRWEALRESFWFLPTVMVGVAIVFSLAMVHLDRAARSEPWMTTLGWTFTRGPEGSRAVLAAVAGSMMTIASVTFSITIVALQLASSQFGPRLLRNFMRDRGNQISMGTFIATFTYCLLVLRTINGTEKDEFVPHLAVTVGLLLAMASLGVLIYFIHHAAESIQAENVIAAVSRDLRSAADRLYPDDLGDEVGNPQSEIPVGFRDNAAMVSSSTSDYLQAIDVDRLMELAESKDLVFMIESRPGKFLFEGGDLVLISPAERVDEELTGKVRSAFYFGQRRTLIQDVEFAIDQLVEIAVRALSPGVNDPFTAINCIDRLGSALCHLAHKKFPSPFRHDEKKRLRVVTDRSTAGGIVEAAFNQIRQAGRRDAAVTIRLLESLTAVARRARQPDFRVALRKQADLIRQGSRDGLPIESDRQDVEARYHVAVQALNT